MSGEMEQKAQLSEVKFWQANGDQVRKVTKTLVFHSFKQTQIESALAWETVDFEDERGNHVYILTFSKKDDNYLIINEVAATPLISESDPSIRRIEEL